MAHKVSPIKLTDQPKMLSKSCYGILKIIYLEFSCDWLMLRELEVFSVLAKRI